ncbi:hypothetical protein PTKIN_Ptkin04bG0227300 [Pterospermum kingtungense]
MLDYRVIELGEEYVFYRSNTDLVCMEKVVFSYLDGNANDFVLLSIYGYGKLAMFKSSDQKWTEIRDTPSCCDDVILYKGNFYAVDTWGRTMLVELDSKTSVVGVPAVYANYVGGYDDVRLYDGNLYVVDARGNAVLWESSNKFLIESKGELLFVDKYLSFKVEKGLYARKYCKFNIYKLDEVNTSLIHL